MMNFASNDKTKCIAVGISNESMILMLKRKFIYKQLF